LSAFFSLHAILLAGCGGTTTPTPIVPVTTEPTIVCPASQTAQSPDGNALAVTFAAPTVANGQSPLTTSCTPISGSLFPLGLQTVTCTVTDALRRANSCLFSVTVLTPPKLAATSFLSFGDSITWGEDGSNGITASASVMSARIHPAVQVPDAEQYPTILQQSLAARYRVQTIKVDNGGKPGEAAGDQTAVPTALVRFIGLITPLQYSVVLIMEGSNDIFYADPTAEQPAIDALRAMLRYAKGISVRPYLATIPPMNPSSTACTPVCRGGGYALVDGLNDQIRTLATTEGVTLVDVNQAFNGNLALIGPDGLHPNADGYAVIAGTFLTAITQTLQLASSSPLKVLTLHRPSTTIR
jgi:lysophospholipase L1-like esterase